MKAIKSWFRGRLGGARGPKDKSGEDSKDDLLEKAVDRDLSGTFHEHLLDRQQLRDLFPQSRINVEYPNISSGLSTKEAKICLEQSGKNMLKPPREISNLKLFLRQFVNMFWVLLIAAGLLSLVIYVLDPEHPLNLYVAIVLFVIVIAMCLLSFYEEKKATEVVRGFKCLMPTSCMGIREGRMQMLRTDELVVGDLVFIRSGARVPADVRLISCNGLKLETSAITGEAEPIDYTDEPAVDSANTVFESRNVAFNGSFCVDGEALGVVIRVGDKTVIGRIASLTTEQKEKHSSLEKELNRFVRFITILALTMATVVFAIGAFVSRFENLLGIFISGFLVVIVANVPQGLPATLTSQLTIIARRMAKKNVFLKKLDIIETFGAATVIASDKTGTLTQNNMTVTDLWYNKHNMPGRPDVKQRALIDRQSSSNILDMLETPLPELLTVMTVCNKAQIDTSTPTKVRTRSVRGSSQILWSPLPLSPMTSSDFESTTLLSKTADSSTYEPEHHISQLSFETAKRKDFTGNPSEVALLRYTAQVVDVQLLRDSFDVVFEIPFNSSRKWHLVITKPVDAMTIEGKTTFTLMIKGAPEVLVELCTELATTAGPRQLDDDLKLDFKDAYLHFGNEGRRVIGFASKTFVAAETTLFSVDEGNYPQSDYCFLGMAALMDPPREDAARAIQECKEAGIKVFMVTGDHPTTAAAIARQIGLLGHSDMIRRRGRLQIQVSVVEEDERDCAIVHGKSLPGLSEQQWDELLAKQHIVFARTTPEHKLLIVEQCQRRGEIVAVTGDGVNDAPALKKADIGVAMGIVGSDVAKQAADIVLMDDNFASIVKGIEEGRLMYSNLKKTIAYTLTHLWPEIMPIILNFMLGFPLALSSLQILSIDLCSEMPPAISLAYETSEQDIMKSPPRKRNSRLVGWRLIAYSYIFAGWTVTGGCFLAYLSVYWYYGISVRDLAFSSTEYWMVGAKDFTSNGHTFTELRQREIMAEAAAAWHITVVMSQIFHLWMCTTRRISIFRHGITNLIGVFACITDLLLVNLFVYTPSVQYIMGTRAPPNHVWLFSLGVGVVLFAFNESRKYLIRHFPDVSIVQFFKW
uniref:Cation-transporting P-type ATPase N-terminal domain-containing protein n=1 Tax=Plectus sambesii TaxID=2011161 RepID=A0A914WES4_9BILA